MAHSKHAFFYLLKIKQRAYEEKRACNSLRAKLCGIRIEKHLQCEKLLGLAGETPKSMETRNPARAELQSVTT